MTHSNNRIAIVTGGSRGIGAAISARLARDGFAVAVNYAGDEKAAAALVSRIEDAGGRAVAIQADVRQPEAMRRLFDAAEAAFGVGHGGGGGINGGGGVNVVVNNAGIMTISPLAAATDESFDRQIAINLKGTFNGMREAARRLGDGGRIINLSTSIVGTRLETYGIYAATKAGVEVMTHILARELRGRNISVNAVAPGPVATELFLNGKSPELIDRLAKIAPMERLGTPDDIANVVSFLAGPEGGWVNGQVIRANGGMV